MRLAGKTIVVTGAAHGIGRAYAERLAREGASVALWDIDGPRNEEVAAGIRAAGGAALATTTDVRSLADVEAATARTVEAFGRIDGLVNNAGMLNVVPISRVTFEHIPDEEWDESFRLNTKSVWYCCKAVVPHLRAAGGGSIVNIASSTIFRGVPTRAHYVAAKSALIGFSRTLARELGGDWIRVNVVCPGSTLSEEDPTPEVVAMREEPVKTRCLKRVERPEDLVGTIVFLMSDDSAFITGQTILVDGGSAFN
ncbi:MAG TPA: SDR family oxidoreductase [Candidatus Limnocylindrales bacterium]|nr:SDR family oxidoreductase [Candidatus Limnocylindrales bacterium]